MQTYSNKESDMILQEINFDFQAELTSLFKNMIMSNIDEE